MLRRGVVFPDMWRETVRCGVVICCCVVRGVPLNSSTCAMWRRATWCDVMNASVQSDLKQGCPLAISIWDWDLIGENTEMCSTMLFLDDSMACEPPEMGNIPTACVWRPGGRQMGSRREGECERGA